MDWDARASRTIHLTVKLLVDDYIAVDFRPKAGKGMHPTIKLLVDLFPC